MISVSGFQVRFTPNWKMTCLGFLAMGFLSYLGYWQLQRAAEKQDWLTRQATVAARPPTTWTPGNKLPTQYTRLRVQGQYLPTIFLLDNQHHAHQFGYDVLSPLVLNNGEVVLVDRGFVPGDLTRRILPRVDTPQGLRTLIGSAYYPSDKNWLLGSLIEREEKNAVVIELPDTRMIHETLHKSVYPFIIRLDNTQPDGFIRDWAVVSMPPSRHQAYALQWFMMAFIVLVLVVVLNFKRSLIGSTL